MCWSCLLLNENEDGRALRVTGVLCPIALVHKLRRPCVTGGCGSVIQKNSRAAREQKENSRQTAVERCLERSLGALGPAGGPAIGA